MEITILIQVRYRTELSNFLFNRREDGASISLLFINPVWKNAQDDVNIHKYEIILVTCE